MFQHIKLVVSFIIFHVYHPNGFKNVEITWELFAPFYSDHFCISVVIKKKKDSFKQIPTTVQDYLLQDPNTSINATEIEHANKNNGSKRKRPQRSLETKKKRRWSQMVKTYKNLVWGKPPEEQEGPGGAAIW